MSNDRPFTTTVIYRTKNVSFALTFNVGDALPFPEPGETSAHPTFVRAVQGQLELMPIENW